MVRSHEEGVAVSDLLVMSVLCGLLAAFAVPGYLNVQRRARADSVLQLSDRIRSAANMAHGIWIATGNSSPISVDGQQIAIVNGFPDAAGMRSLLQAEEGFSTGLSGVEATFTPLGARAPQRCHVTYAEAPDDAHPFRLIYPGGSHRVASALQGSC